MKLKKPSVRVIQVDPDLDEAVTRVAVDPDLDEAPAPKKRQKAVVKANADADEGPVKAFKLGRKTRKVVHPKKRQSFFVAVPKDKLVSVEDLDPNLEYAFFTYEPNNGGYHVRTDTGAGLQRSWQRAAKRGDPDLFKGSYWKMPSNRCPWYHEPTGRWLDVLLHPRRDLYFSVQPVHPRHYATR